jgi:hypothetical protein
MSRSTTLTHRQAPALKCSTLIARSPTPLAAALVGFGGLASAASCQTACREAHSPRAMPPTATSRWIGDSFKPVAATIAAPVRRTGGSAAANSSLEGINKVSTAKKEGAITGTNIRILSMNSIGSGGGSRTPDLRIMIPLTVFIFANEFAIMLRLCCV